MHHPVVLFIGLRYLCKCAKSKFSHFISLLSIIGIMISVMTMIVVLSVMNGFENNLKKNILGLMPQAIVSSKKGFINPEQFPKNAIKLQNINHISPITTGDVMLQSDSEIAIGVILGIDPNQKDSLTKYLLNVKQNELKQGKYNIILGRYLAKKLNVDKGSLLRVVTPSSSKFTPIGRIPNQRIFKVIGVFFSGSEVDSYQMLTNIKDASQLMGYPSGSITGWRLWLKEPFEVMKLNYKTLPNGIVWHDWRERKGEFFQAVQMEKSIMEVLLSLVIVISLFSISSSLGFKVTEKQNEVAILKTQGITHFQIVMIFILQGIGTGIIGASFGVILGIFFTNYIDKISLILGTFFNNEKLPILIEPLQIIIVVSFTISIALLATLYPSWIASSKEPIEVLRYE